MAEVFATVLGTRQINVDIRGSLDGKPALTASRHYATVKQLLREIVNARTWIGFHFRGTTEAGVTLGQSVAMWTLDRYVRPVGDEDNTAGDSE